MQQSWYASITETGTELSTTALEGTVRIVREGDTLKLFADGNPTEMYSKTFTTGSVYISLLLDTFDGTGAMRYHDLVLNAPSFSRYAASGVYTAAVYDAGRAPTWQSLGWEVGDPVGTSVRFQVASSATEAPSSWSFVGPDGTSATWFTTSPSSLPSGLSGAGQRYVRYKAMLMGDGTTTPALHRVDLSFSGDTDSSLTTYDYDRLQSSYDSACFDGFTLDGVDYVDRYDGPNNNWYGSTSFYDVAHFERDYFDLVNGHGDDSAYGSASLGQRAGGNLTRVTKESSSGVMTDVRDLMAFPVADRVNSLNQIQRRDVVAAGSTGVSTTALTYDASGNLTSKTVSGDTTTYTWDEDNRLVRVSLPADTTIDYQYDVAGRMLTKTKTVGAGTAQTWRFEWDGMDLVREYAPSGTGTALFDSAEMDGTATYGWNGITMYYIVNGALLGVDFDGGAMNGAISDALGHVRMLMDPNGDTVFFASYDAYGGSVSVTDSTPCVLFAYRFGGASGIRWDPDISMYLCRLRWYDATEQRRFVSRDLQRTANQYAYAINRPTVYIDSTGLDPEIWIQYSRPIPASWEHQPYPDPSGKYYDHNGNAISKPPAWISSYQVYWVNNPKAPKPQLITGMAVSGMEGSRPQPSDYNNANYGPLPPGVYTINCSEVEDYRNMVKGNESHKIDGGTVGRTTGWGLVRVPLHPDFSTNRNELFLHGHGSWHATRSQGCIGMPNKPAERLFDAIEKFCWTTKDKRQIKVYVNYASYKR